MCVLYCVLWDHVIRKLKLLQAMLKPIATQLQTIKAFVILVYVVSSVDIQEVKV